VKALGLLTLLLLTGCAHQDRAPAGEGPASTAVPKPVGTSKRPPTPSEPTPAPPASVAATPPPATSNEGATGAAAPATPAVNTAHSKPPAVAPRAAPAVAAPAVSAKSAAVPAPLDLAALEQRLRDTRAIGVFTKLSLKNQVDDLLGTFRKYYSGQGHTTLQDAKQQYDLLLLKVLSLLQDGDPPLASSIRESRDAIWNLLADRDQFQKLHL
jgi:hypothetical protein